jgi:hypothetical protein
MTLSRFAQRCAVPVLLALALLAQPAAAQSPGIPITALPAAGSLAGAELLPAAQPGSGTGCVGGYCPVSISPSLLKSWINAITASGTPTTNDLIIFTSAGTIGNAAWTNVQSMLDASCTGTPTLDLVRPDGHCVTIPPGTGTVGTSGSPTASHLAAFTDATHIGVPTITGDCVITGLVITCASIGGDAINLGGPFTTVGAFGLTFTLTAATNATLPPGTVNIGYRGVPLAGGAIQTASYNFVLQDQGAKALMECTANCTVTVPAHSSVAFPAGETVMSVMNGNTSGSFTVGVNITTDTIYCQPGFLTTSITLANGGEIFLVQVDNTHWFGYPGPGVTCT